MSLLIKGVDKPESCRRCRFCIAEDTDDDYSPYYCVNNPYLRWSTSVDIPDYVSLGCKISEIPTPHGRLIDADAYQYSGDLIDEPTIIEAEQGDG